MRRKRRLEGHNKTTLILVIAAIIAILAAIYFVISCLDNKLNYADESVGDGIARSMPDISYNGEQYRYKGRLKNILFLGIDTTGSVHTHEGEYGTGGQSDVIVLMSVDSNNRVVNTMQINRDTMADIATVDENGNATGTVREQLALAYAYGDGQKLSCKNTVETVSRLLYGIPIDEYFAINIDAISIINDDIDGVTVTVQDDLSAIDPSLVPGATVTLMGNTATNFVRARMGVGEGTNVERMSRQRTYLTAFKDKLIGKLEEDPKLITEIDTDIADYRYTSMSLNTIAGILENARDFENTPIIVPDGEIDYSNELVEVTLDEDALRANIVNMFYEKIE